MVQEMFNNNLFVYIMLGLGAFGALLKLILNIVYSRLIKASDNMGTARNKLTQKIKLKFESCYKLNIGVNNVDIFVDKHVYRHKFCGLYLSTWENLCGQVLMLCLLVGSTSAIFGLIYECGKQQILRTFSVGIIISGLLIIFDGIINIPGKKFLIRINMIDYLENKYKVRIEHPEVFEQLESEAEELNNEPHKLTHAEKVYQKELKKQELKNAKIKKKEDAIAKKRLAIETEQRLKREEKLAIERRKAKKLAEIKRRKEKAKAMKLHKKEEKIRQKEIQKALLLERKASKEDKKHKDGDCLTIAQARKENLKKEIQERREQEQLDNHNDNNELLNESLDDIMPSQDGQASNKNDKDNSIVLAQVEYIKPTPVGSLKAASVRNTKSNVIDNVKSNPGTKSAEHLNHAFDDNTKHIKDAINTLASDTGINSTKNNMELNLNAFKTSTNSIKANNEKGRNSKKGKQSSYEEKVIVETLKEFLA